MSSRYSPGITFTKEYVPWSLVVWVCFSEVPVLVSVTCAPTTAAPEGSVTAPETDPYVDCPWTQIEDVKTIPTTSVRNKTEADKLLDDMVSPSQIERYIPDSGLALKC
jgi:hypothetical protein